MQIVIEIDDEDYERLIEYEKAPFNSLTSRVYEAIANGTPLPKGHGRLIDIGKYEKEYFNVAIQYDDGNHVHSDYTNTITTIIEADKAESEDKE